MQKPSASHEVFQPKYWRYLPPCMTTLGHLDCLSALLHAINRFVHYFHGYVLPSILHAHPQGIKVGGRGNWWATFCLTIAHMCSMGLRSGKEGGWDKRLILSWVRMELPILELCIGALSSTTSAGCQIRLLSILTYPLSLPCSTSPHISSH